MTPESRLALKAQLVRQEGVRLSAYRDSLGYLTIGCGRLIDPLRGGGISHEEAMLLLDHDIEKVLTALVKRLPWVADLDDARQVVLANMAFNLGLDGLLTFNWTLSLIRKGDYINAADAMLKSRWAVQVKGRATELAQMMKTGMLIAAKSEPLNA